MSLSVLLKTSNVSQVVLLKPYTLSPVALNGPFSEVFSGEDVVSGSPFQFPNYNSYQYSKIMTPGSR